MRKLTQPAIAAIALLGIAGCTNTPSAEPGPTPPEKPSGALTSLDPCKIMTSQQLQTGGFTFNGRIALFDFLPACSYTSESVGLSIAKNQQETVQSYKENGNWQSYEFIKVNGRPGVRARVAGDTEDSCSTLISAGGGVVQVAAFSGDPRKPIDGCAESLKIAKQIEPNLPE